MNTNIELRPEGSIFLEKTNKNQVRNRETHQENMQKVSMEYRATKSTPETNLHSKIYQASSDKWLPLELSKLNSTIHST